MDDRHVAATPPRPRKAWESSNRRERLPSDWSARRARVLRRDNYLCQLCRRARATDVDHITRGDDHSDANLRALYAACHKAKTQREAVEARRAKYEPRPPKRHPGLID